MVGASAALSMSKIPFAGPVGSSRVAYKDGEYIVNPTYQEIADSQLSLVLSSTPDAIMMIESGSEEVSEETILECIRRANDANQETIAMINDLVSQAGNTKVEVSVDTDDAQRLETRIQGIVDGRLASLLEGNPDKMVLEEGENRIEGEVLEQLAEDYTSQKIKEGFKAVLKYEVRRRILEQGIRPDGRATDEIRPISGEGGL